MKVRVKSGETEVKVKRSQYQSLQCFEDQHFLLQDIDRYFRSIKVHKGGSMIQPYKKRPYTSEYRIQRI